MGSCNGKEVQHVIAVEPVHDEKQGNAPGVEEQQYQKELSETTEGTMAFVKEKTTEEDLGTMVKFAEGVAESLPNPGLKVGTEVPDFTLSDAFGNDVTLKEELKNGPVVLVFYRGAWCPFCNVHLNTFKNMSSMLAEKYGASVIAVTPQKPDISKDQLKKTELGFKVLSDLDDSVMKSYNLYFECTPELLEVYKKLGMDLEAINGEGRTVGLPVPATFIISKSGVVRAMQAETDYMKRMGPDEVIAGLELCL